MTKLSGAFCVVAITMLVSTVANAQAVTAFDGTYQGVSTTVTSGGCTAPAPVPRELTFSNGVGQFDAGMEGTTVFQGNVDGQGNFTLRDSLTDRIDGTIDASGKATGSVNLGSKSCVLTGVWQKKT